jgi:hypothetical protein
MTPQERELLGGFLNNLTGARADNIDPDADKLIRDAFSRQPQAAYLLVQQALLQQMSVREAQARIADLEQQQLRAVHGAAAGTPSFLGAPPPATPPGLASPAPGWGSAPAAAAAPRGSGFGEFLRSAAATAAGVAGGAALFQGLESLFGEHHGMLGGGGIFGSGTPEIVENNTVINEYPDPGLDPLGSSGSGFADDYADADLGGDSDPFDGSDADPVGGGDDSTGWI